MYELKIYGGVMCHCNEECCNEKNRTLHHQKKEHVPKRNTQTKVSDITISTCASKSR